IGVCVGSNSNVEDGNAKVEIGKGCCSSIEGVEDSEFGINVVEYG
ncbi:16388_t:CDS:1, partial [Cetraspora pellucida]